MRRAIVVFVIAAIVVAVIVAIRQERLSDRRAGRLVGDGLGIVYQRARGGEQITDANVKIYNVGQTLVTITGVSFASVVGVKATDVRITVAGAGRVGDGDGGLVFGGPEQLYPARTVKPIAGFELPTFKSPLGRDGAMIIFTAPVPSAPGGLKLDGVRIAYRSGGEARMLKVTHTLLVCAARRAKCEPLAIVPSKNL